MAAAPKPAFSTDEFQRRLTATRQAMARREVDVLLLDQQEHVAYITGYAPPTTRYQVCLVPLEGDPVLLVRPLDEPKVHAQSWLQNYRAYPDTQESMDALAGLIGDQGWTGARLGMEKDGLAMTVEQYETLGALLPDVQLVNVSGMLPAIRACKSAEEVALHRQAAEIADAATMAAIEAIWNGGNERDALVAANVTVLKMGGEEGHVALIRISPPASGDDGGRIIFVETIPHLKGYNSRNIRSAILGPASDGQRETARDLIAIQDAQIAAMKPGARASDVDALCREAVLAAGMRPTYDGVTGHTLGFTGARRSTDLSLAFLPTSDWLLEEGMVFHMFTRGRGIAIGDTVHVTAQGPERLTGLERALFTQE
jgi:Xaa-Pro dipeptidase